MDLTTAVALAGIVIGSAGLAGVLKVFVDGRQGAQKHDLDVLREAMDQLQEENERIRQSQAHADTRNREAIAALHAEYKQRQDALEHEIDGWREKYYKQECTIDDLQGEINGLKRSNRILNRELKKAFRNIADLVVENEELKKAMGGEQGEDA